MIRLPWLFASLFFGASLQAQSNDGDFANCSRASKQLKMLNDYMEPELRIRASQALINDIEALRPHVVKNTTGLPDKLIKLCFDIKRNAFKATFIKGGPSMFGSFEFLMSSGKFFFYEQDYVTAHDAFEEASRLRPNLFDPSFYASQAWIYKQVTAEKPVPTAAYERKLKDYVEKMIKSKDIKPDQKKTVLRFLAGAEEKASKLYTARTMLQRSISLNPSDLRARLQLGEVEEKAGQFPSAIKVYEAAIGTKVIDPPTEKTIYTKLLRLYALMGQKKKLADTAARAIALYPGDKEIQFFQGNRSPANVKK